MVRHAAFGGEAAHDISYLSGLQNSSESARLRKPSGLPPKTSVPNRIFRLKLETKGSPWECAIRLYRFLRGGFGASCKPPVLLSTVAPVFRLPREALQNPFCALKQNLYAAHEDDRKVAKSKNVFPEKEAVGDATEVALSKNPCTP